MNPKKHAPALLLGAAASIAALQTLAHDGRAGPDLTSVSPAVLVPGVNSAQADGCPIETADGLSLLFASARPGGVAGNKGNDIWVADRDSLTAPWQEPRNIGEPINSAAADLCPTPARGRWLFFVSERLDNGTVTPPCGGGDMYLSRQSPAGGWSTPTMLACAPDGPNFAGPERSPSLVETWYGTFLFYSSNNGSGSQDIFMSRMRKDGTFGPGEVVKELSTPFEDIMPNVRERKDGSFEIVFSSNRPTWGNNQPAKGGQDVYISRAWGPLGPWSTPQNVANVNTPGVEQRATLSADGKRLYFGRDGDIFVSARLGRN